MKSKFIFSGRFASKTFETRIIYFFITILIVLPLYEGLSIYLFPNLDFFPSRSKEIIKIENRLGNIEEFLEMGRKNRLGRKHLNKKTISDFIDKKIPDVNDIEDQIEEIRRQIKALQTDSHYHY